MTTPGVHQDSWWVKSPGKDNTQTTKFSAEKHQGYLKINDIKLLDLDFAHEKSLYPSKYFSASQEQLH